MNSEFVGNSGRDGSAKKTEVSEAEGGVENTWWSAVRGGGKMESCNMWTQPKL